MRVQLRGFKKKLDETSLLVKLVLEVSKEK